MFEWDEHLSALVDSCDIEPGEGCEDCVYLEHTPTVVRGVMDADPEEWNCTCKVRDHDNCERWVQKYCEEERKQEEAEIDAESDDGYSRYSTDELIRLLGIAAECERKPTFECIHTGCNNCEYAEALAIDVCELLYEAIQRLKDGEKLKENQPVPCTECFYNQHGRCDLYWHLPTDVHPDNYCRYGRRKVEKNDETN